MAPRSAVSTSGAAESVRRRLASRVRVHASDDGEHVTGSAIACVLGDLDARVALCEGGPHLAGTLAKHGLVDELFLTVAPQLLGRGTHADRRLSIISGVEFGLDDAPWARLMAVRK